MKTLSLIALAVSGVFVASAGASAAEIDVAANAFMHTAAMVAPSLSLGTPDDPKEIIQPPSSIDPGMALDPPHMGAKMPVIHPPGTAGGRLVLPH
jgi:hypothetical protein